MNGHGPCSGSGEVASAAMWEPFMGADPEAIPPVRILRKKLGWQRELESRPRPARPAGEGVRGLDWTRAPVLRSLDPGRLVRPVKEFGGSGAAGSPPNGFTGRTSRPGSR